jgi:hypothetical protein
MKGHVDPEDLALGREGLLSRRKAARMRAHVSRCARCAEVDAELAALPSLLAQAAVPLTAVPPMPADLAARIDAVIAAEANGSQPDGRAPDPVSLPVADGSAPRDKPPLVTSTVVTSTGLTSTGLTSTGARKILALAAAVVLVAAGGGYLLSRLPSSSSGPSASSAAAPATAGRPAAGQVNAAAGDGGFTVISSGTDYQPATLPAQIAAVLTRYGLRATGKPVAAPTRQAAPEQAPSQHVLQPSTLAALQGCVARIAAGQRPWMVDESRYHGRPATIIVLHATARSLTQVWVVGPACSGSRRDVVAHTALPAVG